MTGVTGRPVVASQTWAIPLPHAVANRSPRVEDRLIYAAGESTAIAERPTAATFQSRAIESEPTVSTCEPSGVNRARTSEPP